MNPTLRSKRAHRSVAQRSASLIAAGLFSLTLSLSSPDAGARDMQVADGGSGVYKVNGGVTQGDRAASHATERSDGDILFGTGRGAILDVLFPNGMNWHLTENSRLFLQSFTYRGMAIETDYVPAPWNEKVLKAQENATIRERAPSIWQARLEEGQVLLSGLWPERQSRNVLFTPEARIDLKVVSATVRRNATDGTVIDVLSGHVNVTLPNGRTVTADSRMRLTVTRDGEVLRARVEPGTALVPARPGRGFLSFVDMPRTGIPEILPISPSS